jgi:hypothetical protein
MFLYVVQVAVPGAPGHAGDAPCRATVIVYAASAARSQLTARRLLRDHGWDIVRMVRVDRLRLEQVADEGGEPAVLAEVALRRGAAFHVELPPLSPGAAESSPASSAPLAFLRASTAAALLAPAPALPVHASVEASCGQLLQATRAAVARMRRCSEEFLDERQRAKHQLAEARGMLRKAREPDAR